MKKDTLSKLFQGKHVVKAAAKRIKAMDMEPRSVTLVIYEDEIKIADHGSQDDLKMFPILDVSFTALDSKDARLLYKRMCLSIL